MEKTESIVIPVDPAYENHKIKEMEAFGWNLHGRQEIRKEKKSPGETILLSREEYVEFYHHVKLHFTRSLSFPNRDRIKALEAQYFGLRFPQYPPLGTSRWLIRVGSVDGLVSVLTVLVFWGYKPKKAAADAQLAETLRKQQEISSEVSSLL
ncbi:hypothetical protein LM597_02355 [Candidatus Acetothermia bacterium]|nr:hypothetical protein [Candidatus Acetothermia bacterium]